MVNYLKMDIWFKYQMLIEDYQMVKLLNQDLISEIISILMKIFVVISLYLVEEDLNQLTFKMCQKCSKKMVLQDLNILLKVQIYFSLMVQGIIYIKYRKKLESSGVILFKDSSTNKGGVTSSSFEV